MVIQVLPLSSTLPSVTAPWRESVFRHRKYIGSAPQFHRLRGNVQHRRIRLTPWYHEPRQSHPIRIPQFSPADASSPAMITGYR